MRVLNASSLPPIPPPTKNSTSKRAIRTLNLLSSLSSSPLFFPISAKALTYDDLALGFPTPPSDFDLGRIVDGIIKFGSENPLIVAGGVALLFVPVIVSRALGGSKAWGVESAKRAYQKLGEEEGAQLLDIREGKEAKEAGSPDLRGLKKKVVAIAYRVGEDKAGFLKKIALRFKDPGNTTLFVVDKFDGNSELVAELLTTNGFKAAFAIKDGAEGPGGWKNSGLPWTSPKKTLLLDFGELTDALTSSIGETDGIPVTLGLAAATGLGLFAFTEIETLLQLLGSAAIIQLITKKLLFAEDRKVTLQQVDEFLNTKVAPKELADEIKMIGKALLPTQSRSQTSLPAPAEVTPVESPSATPEQNVEPEPTQAVNSVPRADFEETGRPTPLSPYPYYPDFKPPSSPSPSPP